MDEAQDEVKLPVGGPMAEHGVLPQPTAHGVPGIAQLQSMTSFHSGKGSAPSAAPSSLDAQCVELTAKDITQAVERLMDLVEQERKRCLSMYRRQLQEEITTLLLGLGGPQKKARTDSHHGASTTSSRQSSRQHPKRGEPDDPDIDDEGHHDIKGAPTWAGTRKVPEPLKIAAQADTSLPVGFAGAGSQELVSSVNGTGNGGSNSVGDMSSVGGSHGVTDDLSKYMGPMPAATPTRQKKVAPDPLHANAKAGLGDSPSGRDYYSEGSKLHHQSSRTSLEDAMCKTASGGKMELSETDEGNPKRRSRALRQSSKSGLLRSSGLLLHRGSTSRPTSSRSVATRGSSMSEALALVDPEYELLPFWTAAQEKVQALQVSQSPSRISNMLRTNTELRRLTMHHSRGSTSWPTSEFGELVTNPMSRPRVFWEAMGVFFICYDLISIPLEAFDSLFSENYKLFRRILMWVTVSYWTLDVPCSFFVAFYRRGILESRVWEMAKHYLRTWFVPDCTIIIFDWIVLMLENADDTQDVEASHGMKYVKAGRTLRMLRFLRLIRLLRLHSFFQKMLEQIHSEYLLTILNVSKLIVFIVIVNHFVACAWYSIGDLAEGYTWVQEFFQGNSDLGYRYSTSLHWSLTQFTPASMEVVPTNMGERIFSVCVVLFAMVLFSSFISSITEAMTHLRKINNIKNTQYSALRRYFAEHQVSMGTAVRVWRYLEQCVKDRQKRKLWQDVELFKELPESLQMDLHAEVYEPTVMRHPFFHQYGHYNVGGIRAICHQGCDEMTLFAGQDLFHTGQAGTRLYFLVDGVMEYQRMNHEETPLRESFRQTSKSKLEDSWTVRNVYVGQWFCEASLFVHWFHQGVMAAKTLSALVMIDAAAFHKVLLQYVDTLMECVRYAESFKVFCRENHESLSDLAMDFDYLQDMSQRAFDPPMDTEGIDDHPDSQRSLDANGVDSNSTRGSHKGGLARFGGFWGIGHQRDRRPGARMESA